jgi:hypothetical protein
MSAPTLTYARYRELGGSAGEDAFAASLPWASRHVAAACWPNEPAPDTEGAWLAAVAAAVDVDVEWGGTHGAGDSGSLSIGGFSTSGGSGGEPFADELTRAVSDALAGTGLLCRVVV